jgi:Trk-type K+ transport system membrane component
LTRSGRWLAYSEVSALPAFATIGVTAVAYGDLSPIAGVLIAMVLGAIGFPLFLDGAQWLFRKRLGMPTHVGSTEDA